MLNRVTLIGNLGKDPEVKVMTSGDKIVNFSLATSESWKDKTTGERKSKSQWHNICVFNKALVSVCENYLKKGSKIYLEGQIETRSWEQDGVTKYATEIVLQPFKSQIIMLDSRGGEQSQGTPQQQNSVQDSLDDDEIPF